MLKLDGASEQCTSSLPLLTSGLVAKTLLIGSRPRCSGSRRCFDGNSNADSSDPTWWSAACNSRVCSLHPSRHSLVDRSDDGTVVHQLILCTECCQSHRVLHHGREHWTECETLLTSLQTPPITAELPRVAPPKPSKRPGRRPSCSSISPRCCRRTSSPRWLVAVALRPLGRMR